MIVSKASAHPIQVQVLVRSRFLSRGPLQARRLLSTDDNRSINDFFADLGIDKDLHKDVTDAAKKLLGDNLTSGSLSHAFGGDEGVVQFANSIQDASQKQRRTEQRKHRPSVNVTLSILQSTREPPQKITVPWKHGESLLALAQNQYVQQKLEDDMQYRMEGSCGGQMSCSTCQVYLDQVTYDAMTSPTEQEQDMLDLAFEPKPTSRLGCQVKLDNALVKLAATHSIEVSIPSQVIDAWET
jgi:ferredoxin